MPWGIVRNIPLPFSSFQRSPVVEGKATGRHERPRGTPQEWVRKAVYFGGICAQMAFSTTRKCSLASAALKPDKRCGTVARFGVYLAGLLPSKFPGSWGEHAHQHRPSFVYEHLTPPPDTRPFPFVTASVLNLRLSRPRNWRHTCRVLHAEDLRPLSVVLFSALFL